MKEKRMAIMIGIQGSGKSTFCEKYLVDFFRINFDKLPCWQKRGIGFYFGKVEKVGYNPMEKMEVKTFRNEIIVDMEPELGEKYAEMIKKLAE